MAKDTINWHFSRPELANKYLELFRIGLTSARGLFARRRMGKTEFLKKDFIPEAIRDGYVAVYVNLWDLESDPATAITSEFYKAIAPKGFKKVWDKLKQPINKVKAAGKVGRLIEGSIEANFKMTDQVAGTLLMEAMAKFDKKRYSLCLVLDEAQVLAYEQNTHFAHALRSALDIRKDRIKVIFAGSSEATLRRMFGVASEPFYNWAPLEPFELLGDEFVAAMVDRVNHICRFPLALSDAKKAYSQLKNVPEFFRRFIECYLYNPTKGMQAALEETKSKVFDETSYLQQWEMLLPADKGVLSILATDQTDLFSNSSLRQLSKLLGIESEIHKSTVQNTVRRLIEKNLLIRISHGIYQFQDEAFKDWIRYSDQ